MTLDTRSRVLDTRMLVVEHAQMFAEEVAEDLQLHHRLHVSRPAQHETPGLSYCCWLCGAPEFVSQQALLRHG